MKSPQSLTRWIFLLYLAFVIYGSLVPLKFVPLPLSEAFSAFANIPFLDLGIGSRADWVANLLLFIPLTFLATETFARPRRQPYRLVMTTAVIAGAITLAFGIEFTQLFFPQRTVSQNDILAEGLGGLIGVVLSGFIGARFQTWLVGVWASETRKGKAIHLLQAYLLLLFTFNVLPLDLTISPVEIFHKWRQGKVILIPFTGVNGTVSDFIYEKLTDIAVWIPAGLLWGRTGRFSVARTAVMGLLAALTIEVLQLFVYSRVTDVTDVILGGLGCLLGAYASLYTDRRRGTSFVPVPSTSGRWLTGWLLWLVAISVVFWFPFNFTSSHVTWNTAVDAFTRTPLTTYYFGSEYHAINELLRKVGFFFPGGLLLGLAVYSKAAVGHRGLWPWAILFFVLGGGIEVGQLFLPGKVADITDVFLEGGGGLLGIAVIRWMTREGSAMGIPVSRKRPLPVQPKLKRMTFDLYHLVFLAILTALILGLSKLPGIPYNVRELVDDSFLSALGLASVFYLASNSIFLLVQRHSRRLLVLFPILLVLQGLVVWFVLRLVVHMESIHDVVGSPILNWPWEWELLVRFVALHQAISTQIFGATLLVCAICRPFHAIYWVYWLMLSLMLAWPLHVVIVDWAATDNLTELMRDGGSNFSSSCLALGTFMTCVAGSALGAAIYFPEKRRQLLVTLLGASAVTIVALDWGAEPALVKYGQVFSAAQFILSPDRAHYLQGTPLLLRFFLFFTLATAGLAVIQSQSWKWFRNAE